MKLITIVCSLIVSVLSLNPIVIKGTRFFDSVTKQRFFIKGVAYQPRANPDLDPLSVPNDCSRDAKYMLELGLNAIRVYRTDPKLNHDACMKIFEEAGIYVGLDLPTPNYSVNRNNPEYTLDIMNHYISKIDAFAKYPNTLLFFAGNEVTNDDKTTAASSYVKAALRDAKKYIKSKYRAIPIGYADNDDDHIRANVQAFFDCGSDEERVDFYGINIYSWCGHSSFENSNYKLRTSELKDYNVPVFLSEFGCEQEPREFGDIVSLYNQDMNQVFSGGFIYEFTNEENRMGLVEIKSGQVNKLPAFNYVKKHLAQVNLPKDNINSEQPDSRQRDCPNVSDTWLSSNMLPPQPNHQTCDCIMDQLPCHVKLSTDTITNQKVGRFLDYACTHKHCNDITPDQRNGKYGAYSFCPLHVKASVALSSMSLYNNGKCQDENLKGLTSTNSPKKSDSCKSLSVSDPSSTSSNALAVTSDKIFCILLLLASIY